MGSLHEIVDSAPIKPNCFIVGAAKAGTTSVHAYLQQHPQVFMSHIKEPHFYANINPRKEQEHIVKVIKSEDEYYELFKEARGYSIRGEASPSYLYDEQAPLKIYKDSPEAKIIIILRDPIERAYSHYLMDVREGIQNLPFFDALNEDYRQKEKGWGVSHLYVELGMYYEQIKRYLDIFDADQMLILMYEDLKRNPAHFMDQIYQFLKISSDQQISVEQIHNAFAAPRNRLTQHIVGNRTIRSLSSILPSSIKHFVKGTVLLKRGEKPEMDIESRYFLQEIYEPEVGSLEALLERNFDDLRKAWINKRYS